MVETASAVFTFPVVPGVYRVELKIHINQKNFFSQNFVEIGFFGVSALSGVVVICMHGSLSVFNHCARMQVVRTHIDYQTTIMMALLFSLILLLSA